MRRKNQNFNEKEEYVQKAKDVIKNPLNYPFGWLIYFIDTSTTGVRPEIENEKNPDGTTNYKAIFGLFWMLQLFYCFFYIYLRVTKQI